MREKDNFINRLIGHDCYQHDIFKSISCQDEKDAICIALHLYLVMSKRK